MAKKKKSSPKKKPSPKRKAKTSGIQIQPFTVNMDALPVEAPLGLPLLWADRVVVTRRNEQVVLRFQYLVPFDKLIEVSRMQISTDTANKLSEILKVACVAIPPAS